jgi:hypothetical protein
MLDHASTAMTMGTCADLSDDDLEDVASAYSERVGSITR